jgi:hypothetical protein
LTAQILKLLERNKCCCVCEYTFKSSKSVDFPNIGTLKKILNLHIALLILCFAKLGHFFLSRFISCLMVINFCENLSNWLHLYFRRLRKRQKCRICSPIVDMPGKITLLLQLPCCYMYTADKLTTHMIGACRGKISMLFFYNDRNENWSIVCHLLMEYRILNRGIVICLHQGRCVAGVCESSKFLWLCHICYIQQNLFIL